MAKVTLTNGSTLLTIRTAINSMFTELYSAVAGKAEALTGDQNYVSDAELSILQSTSGENTGDQDLSGYQLILAEGAFEDGDKTWLDNAQPSLGTVGAAGNYLIEENLSGVHGLSVPGTWKLFYSDGSGGGLKEFSIGSIGTYLKSNGTGGAPSWDTPTNNIITKTATAANNFSVGTVGYLSSAGTITLADADAEASSKNLLVMATDTITGGNSGVFMRRGDVTVTGHGFTIGVPLYLSATDGAITETIPSSGDFARVIGYALDANTISFQPDPTWTGIQ